MNIFYHLEVKIKAEKRERNYQLCLQLFCQEEFLCHLEKFQNTKNLVLKGGLFIYYVTDFNSRVVIEKGAYWGGGTHKTT